MIFSDLLLRAKAGEETALLELLEMYRPLLIKESVLCGRIDEDLFQEESITFLRCIEKFNISK